jgi:hypothetical protein
MKAQDLKNMPPKEALQLILKVVALKAISKLREEKQKDKNKKS